MIIVKLLGGLGNQMFQYALGRQLSIRHNTELKLDVTELLDRTPKDYAFRDLRLDVFNIDIQFATQRDLRNYYLNFDTRRQRLTGRIYRRLFNYSVHFESSNEFIPGILETKRNSYLGGYWQSEKYFKEIESVLRKDFTLKAPLTGTAQEIGDLIQDVESVSIHVRRGDYVFNKGANEFLGVCSIDYYKSAIRFISETVGNPHFFIFSDDIEWVKKNLEIGHPCHFVENQPDYTDLYLMSLCKHNILANSSFSWWGAWLNANLLKTVIYPQKWHRDENMKTSDLIPAGWYPIESSHQVEN